MDVAKIPVGIDPPFDLNAIIEIPQGGEPVKYELDKESGAMFVDRFLHTAMFYPGNYGFIPHTLSDDGDPCDVLVVGQVPVVPGAVIRCRPIGALLMQERRPRDADQGLAGRRLASRSRAAFAAWVRCDVGSPFASAEGAISVSDAHPLGNVTVVAGAWVLVNGWPRLRRGVPRQDD